MFEYYVSEDKFNQLNKEINKYGTLAHHYRILSESKEEEVKNIYNRKAIKLLKKLKYFN
jgi:hypothetical protein